jgi:hypothetical protein
MRSAVTILFAGCFLLNGFAAAMCAPEICHIDLSQGQVTVPPCHKQVPGVSEQAHHKETACLCAYTNAPGAASGPRLTYSKPAFSSFLISDIQGFLKNKPAILRADRIPIRAYIRDMIFLEINRLLI